MVAIYKTYVSSYDDLKEIIDWAKKTTYTCPNGIKLRVIDYCYYPYSTEEEIREWLKESSQIPVMNTPESLDYFLLKDCPIKVIQDRLRVVYDDSFILGVLSGTSDYDLFRRPIGGKHIRLVIKPRFKKPKFKRYFVGVNYPDMEGYNEDYDT